ncbi:MAG: hypothetical protein AAGB29_06260 [Planctomycetota bacterium]
MSRSLYLRRIAQPISVLIPLLAALVAFVKTQSYGFTTQTGGVITYPIGHAFLEAAMVMVYAAILCLPIFAARYVAYWRWWLRAMLAGPMLLLGGLCALSFYFGVSSLSGLEGLPVVSQVYSLAIVALIGLLAAAQAVTAVVMMLPGTQIGRGGRASEVRGGKRVEAESRREVRQASARGGDSMNLQIA